MRRTNRRPLFAALAVAMLIGGPVRAAAEDPLDEKLRHCPASVPNVRVEIRDVEEGVEVTVTATSAGAVEEIRRRVAHLEEFTAKGGRGTGVPHGGGQGGGWMRECPIVSKDTRVAGTEVPNGARIRIRPKRSQDIFDLRAEVRTRWAAFVKR